MTAERVFGLTVALMIIAGLGIFALGVLSYIIQERDRRRDP